MSRFQTCLVTGGAGFMGSHLCERLIERGHRVVCIDNLLTGRVENLSRLLAESRFHFIQRDVMAAPPAKLRPDRIYHLACAASPRHYQLDPVYTTMTCVIGTRNYLDLARASRARFLLASTSEVYGDPDVHPQKEDYRGSVSTTGPRACYDEGKRAAETLTTDYHRTWGVDVRIARIFNTYGPRLRVDDGRVVSNFIVQCLRGQPLTLYGDGHQTRSFCYVDDMIDGLVELMASEAADCLPVNLGNPAEFSMLELAELIMELCGKRVRLQSRPLPQDDPKRRRPDITRARALLGWEPRTPLPTGLRTTIAAFAAEEQAAVMRHQTETICWGQTAKASLAE